MKLSELNVVIVDDSILKAMDIRKALEFCGVRNIAVVRSQDRVWDEIDKGNANGKKVGLIITDMHYPLVTGGDADEEAGFKLIERMKAEGLDIPVIICSSRNYTVPEILGCVWYSELNDIEYEFQEVLLRYMANYKE